MIVLLALVVFITILIGNLYGLRSAVDRSNPEEEYRKKDTLHILLCEEPLTRLRKLQHVYEKDTPEYQKIYSLRKEKILHARGDVHERIDLKKKLQERTLDIDVLTNRELRELITLSRGKI
ncbi:MAG: hypothetical protein WC916_03705 [Candidatus Woesearchaeota archaeon]